MDEESRFSQTTLREPRFNSSPSHPLDRPTRRRTRKTGGIPAGMRPQGPDAPPAPPDTLREGPRQTPQEGPLPQRGVRIRGQGAHGDPLQPDEGTDQGRGLPHHRGLPARRGPQDAGEPAPRSRRAHPGGLPRRNGPPVVEQQGPPRHPAGPRRPRGQGGPGQEGVLPRIPVPVPRRRRGLPAGPRGGAREREREGPGGAPAGQGSRRGPGGGARRGGQPVRVPEHLRRPRRQEGGAHHRLEADEGQGEPVRRSHGEGPDRRGGS